jgi:hypothetical protein
MASEGLMAPWYHYFMADARRDLATGEHVERSVRLQAGIDAVIRSRWVTPKGGRTMSLTEVKVARESLLRFHLPAPGIKYGKHGLPVKRVDLDKQLDGFVSLAAAFARALEAAGGAEELKRRAALFEELTASGTTFDEARRTAYEAISPAIEPFKPPASSHPNAAKPRAKVSITGRSPQASGWEVIAGEIAKVERLVGDRDHVLDHLPEALAYADRLVDLAPSCPEGAALRRWRDELFRLKQQVDASHLLGAWLILRCRDALNEEQGGYGSHQEVIALLSSDPPRLVKAVQDAAATLASEGGEAPQLVPASKRSARQRTPAKNAAAEQHQTPDTTILTIDRWAELAIGIHEKGFYAISPCPEAGDIVSITKAHQLILPGKRWPKVLDVFAISEDGTLGRKQDLLTQLGYLQFGQARMAEAIEEEDEGPPRKRGAQARYDDKLREFRPLINQLTNTMADLGRELRDLIRCLLPQPGPFESLYHEYRAAFTVGYLVKDHKGRLRFRRIPDKAL